MFNKRRRIVLFVILVLLGGVLLINRKQAEPSKEIPNNKGQEGGVIESIAQISDNGGRVAWYQGAKHELIAYDAISNKRNKNTDVYTMEPDGSNVRCVTCDALIPKGFVGQPVWHPDGEHLIIQAENANSSHSIFDHMSFGFNNDLWIIRRDGSGAKKIWSTKLNHAALHPQFNEDGTRLMFAERIPTGKSFPLLENITPGGENHWDGWQIHIANFDSATQTLTNHKAIRPNGTGFYETHEFTKDGRILYSHTPKGLGYVDDVYVSNLNGTGVVNLIKSSTTWEEHGSYSPSGSGTVAFISSRDDASWVAPQSKIGTLSTELYAKTDEGIVLQLTQVNKQLDLSERYLVSDFDWDREGKRIVFQVAPGLGKRNPESPRIWMITLVENL